MEKHNLPILWREVRATSEVNPFSRLLFPFPEKFIAKPSFLLCYSGNTGTWVFFFGSPSYVQRPAATVSRKVLSVISTYPEPGADLVEDFLFRCPIALPVAGPVHYRDAYG